MADAVLPNYESSPKVIHESRFSKNWAVKPAVETESSSLTEAILETVDIISTKTVKTSTAKTLTLEAKIVKVLDKGRGIYKVQYLDNLLEAQSSNAAVTYNENDIVYIVVPEGDFTKQIVILSLVSSENANAFIVEQDLNIRIGDSIFGAAESVSLCSFHNEEKTFAIDKILFSQLFPTYLKDTRTFCLNCAIETKIEIARRARGNYGLILTIPLKDENGTKISYTTTLDINNILGDAYNFNVPAVQNYYFEIPEKTEFDNSDSSLLTFTAFVKDFPNITEAAMPDDIFFTDINLYPIKVVNRDNKEGYYLNLTAEEGSVFWSNGNPTKKLTPDLYLNGKQTLPDSFDCYWFKENYRVGIGHEKYNSFGGIGWEILNEKIIITNTTDGSKGFSYITNVYEYKVNIDEVHANIRYKCVLVNPADSMILTDTITLRNIANPAILELSTSTGKTNYIKNVGEVTLVLKYSDSDLSDNDVMAYAWKRFDKYGSEIDDSSNPDIFKVISQNVKVEEDGVSYLVTKVSLPVKEIYDKNTINCTAYQIKTIDTIGDNQEIVKEIDEDIFGSVSIVLTTSDAPGCTLMLENADRIFKYDSDGDSPLVANYDGPLSSALKAIPPITVRAYKEDGTEFTADEYAVSRIEWRIPKNSLIQLNTSQYENLDSTSEKDYYVIAGNFIDNNELTYSISVVYNSEQSRKNVIRVKVFFQNKVIEDKATLKFLKDGESGTNGSKYAAIITYHDRAYEELNDKDIPCKLQLVYFANTHEWYIYDNDTGSFRLFPTDAAGKEQYLTFKVKLYADGEPISDNDRTTVTSDQVSTVIEWNIFDHQNFAKTTISPITIDANGIISIVKETVPQGNTFIERDIRWEDPDKQIFCATLEAKCTAKRTSVDEKSGTNKMFEEYVYAYYPIEVTYSQTKDIIDEHNNIAIIPHMEGGFSQVLYASDGTNPQYNNSDPFHFVDSVSRETGSGGSTYNWSTSNSLSIQELVKAEDGEEIDTFLNKNILPTTSRASDGNSTQYVKVAYGYSDDMTDTARAKKAELLKYQEYYTKLKEYYDMIDTDVEVIGEFTNVYNNILSNIQGQDSLIADKDNFCAVINKAFTTVLNFREQNLDIVNNIMTSDGITHLHNLLDNLTELLAAANKIGEITLGTIVNYFDDKGSYEQVCHKVGDTLKGVLLNTDPSFLFNSNLSKKEQTYADDLLKNFIIYNSSMSHGDYKYFYDGLTNNLYDDLDVLLRYIKNSLTNYLVDNIIDPETQQPKDRWTKLKSTITIQYDPEDLEEPDLPIIIDEYKDFFTSLYDKLETIIDNLSGKNFKSYDNIYNAIKPMYDILWPYIGFKCITEDNKSKADITEEKLEEIDKDIKSCNEIIKVGGVDGLVHIKPIIMLLNRYEHSHINGWDGNKLTVDEDKGYILAPQCGAGMKENDGTFTGVVMGIYHLNQSGILAQEVGLFGMKSGERSFFLDAQTGKGIFGNPKLGQIIIDPSDPSNEGMTIKSSDYIRETGGAGLCINFTKSFIHFGQSQGYIASGNHTSLDAQVDGDNNIIEGFYLSHDGLSIGNGVRIEKNGYFWLGPKNNPKKSIIYDPSTGTFEIGNQITLTASQIAANVGISCNGSELTSDGYFHVQNHFKVHPNGNVYIGGNVNIDGESVTVKGVLTAQDGSWIGNWRIKENGKLLGYKTKAEDQRGVDFSSLRLDPGVGDVTMNKPPRIGFWTGGYLDNKTKHDFCYIGTGEAIGDNTLGIYTSNTEDRYGSLKCKAVYTAGCAVKTDYIYIGCAGENEGISQGHGLRIGGRDNNGKYHIQKVVSTNSGYKWRDAQPSGGVI